MESMKWLTDLVEGSHSSLEVLPVPCLCEFLMAGYQDKSGGGGGLDSGESDSLSHRTHYKRKKSAKDKVGVTTSCIAGNFVGAHFCPLIFCTAQNGGVGLNNFAVLIFKQIFVHHTN